MQRQHRQEGQESTCHQDREDIAEVGAGGNLDVLEHVGEGFAAFQHAFFEHHQTLFQQNQIRCFLSDVDGGINGDTDVGCPQRRCIVDAVAHEADHMAQIMQRTYDTFFMDGAELGEHSGFFDHLVEFGIAHRFYLRTQYHAFDFEANLVADLGRHQFIVAGQNFDRHAMRTQCCQRWSGRFLWWVEEGDITDKHQIRFVGYAIDFLGWRQILGGYGDHAQAFRVQTGRCFSNLGQQLRGKWHDLTIVTGMGADGDDFFDRAFADQLMVIFTFADHHRHAAALEVEGDFIDLAIGRGDRHFALQFGMFQNSHVEQVFQAGLVVAVEVGILHHFVVGLAQDVRVAFQDDLVLRQSAGLVGTQYVHGAEILNGVEPLDDHFLARQRHGAFGQCRGDDHRQHFRCQADGNRDCEQEGFNPVTLGETVHEEDHRGHDKHEADQQPADLVDARLECRRSTVSGGDALGQGAKIGAFAGGDDDRTGRAADHVGTHEAQVV